MTVNVQLQVSGDNIATYDIYQNTDNFATALATNVTVAELQSDYALTADNSASVIRFVPNGACDNYKDIFINFNDTTPSITLIGDYETGIASQTTYGTDIATSNTGYAIAVSRSTLLATTDNGSNWTSYGEGDATEARVVHVKDNEFRVMKKSGEYTRWTPLSGVSGWSSAGLSHNIAEQILDFVIHNGVYYARTEYSLYRSEDGSSFISVLDYDSWDYVYKNSIAGYGNTLWVAVGKKLFKSTDNGLNWSVIKDTNTGFPTNYLHISIYAESESRILSLMMGSSDLRWYYSTDGGTTVFESWLKIGFYVENLNANDIAKIGDVYYFVGRGDSLSYTSDDLYSNTDGVVNVIPNSEADGTGSIGQQYTAVSIIGSEDRILYYRPKKYNDTISKKNSIWTGKITNA
jgi:hypothetical protein